MRFTGIASLCVLVSLMLTGCAEQQAQQQRRAMVAAAAQQRQAAIADCEQRFSESNKDAIARAKCLNAADAIMVPFETYPDLPSLVMAKRIELAEKQAAGKITHAQVVLETNQLIAQVVSETQRRWAASSVAQSQANANNSLAAAALLQSMQANQAKPYYIPTR